LIISSYDGPVHITANNLRDLHNSKIITIYVYSVGAPHDINSELAKFKWGFYDIRLRGGKLLVLLDGSLVDPTDPNYYVVIAPDPVANRNDIYQGLRTIRSADEVDYSPVLLEYLQQHGTYYKLEDLATVIRANN